MQKLTVTTVPVFEHGPVSLLASAPANLSGQPFPTWNEPRRYTTNYCIAFEITADDYDPNAPTEDWELAEQDKEDYFGSFDAVYTSPHTLDSDEMAECGLSHSHGPHNYPGSELGPDARQRFCDGF